jgi:hypothetical protein
MGALSCSWRSFSPAVPIAVAAGYEKFIEKVGKIKFYQFELPRLNRQRVAHFQDREPFRRRII